MDGLTDNTSDKLNKINQNKQKKSKACVANLLFVYGYENSHFVSGS